MHARHFTIDLASLMLLGGAQTIAAPLSNPAGLTLALDGRNLKVSKTGSGFALSGQALVPACQAARFVLSSMHPLQYDLVQFRRPSTLGTMCVARTDWATAAPLTIASDTIPASVIVRTQKTPYTLSVH